MIVANRIDNIFRCIAVNIPFGPTPENNSQHNFVQPPTAELLNRNCWVSLLLIACTISLEDLRIAHITIPNINNLNRCYKWNILWHRLTGKHLLFWNFVIIRFWSFRFQLNQWNNWFDDRRFRRNSNLMRKSSDKRGCLTCGFVCGNWIREMEATLERIGSVIEGQPTKQKTKLG